MGHIYHDHIYRKKERKDFRISIGGEEQGREERRGRDGGGEVKWIDSTTHNEMTRKSCRGCWQSYETVCGRSIICCMSPDTCKAFTTRKAVR